MRGEVVAEMTLLRDPDGTYAVQYWGGATWDHPTVRDALDAVAADIEPSLARVMAKNGEALASSERFKELFGDLPKDGEG